MIVTDDRAPRWLRELARYQAIKNLIFLYGNILDTVPCPIEKDGALRWISMSLPDALVRFLSDMGYEEIGVFHPVTGLSSPLGTAEPAAARPSATASGLPAVATAVARISESLSKTDHTSAFVFPLASRLLVSPGRPTPPEHEVFTRLLQASLQGATVKRETGQWRNLILLICDKLNDLPPYLYVDNPRARSIHIERPTATERARMLDALFANFHGVTETTPRPEVVRQLALLTEGFAHDELTSLGILSRKEGIAPWPVEPLVQRYKYGITRSEWDDPRLRERLREAEPRIRERVKGQEIAVARVLDLIKRACLNLAAGGRNARRRPRGVLFFAGPTGVGKTELAKTLATLLFGSEDRLLRFDMSEYGAEHADQRLLGSPPGYVGYEEGGQLTNRLKEQPFSVLLFDEIDKAHWRIFDKFLQILDDGRLTDGKGETVYFSECIIIFTSNLGAESALAQDQPSPAPPSKPLAYPQLQDRIMDAIRAKFNTELKRPEILNRFGDSFVVFDYIRPPVDGEILDLLLDGLVRALAEERQIALTVRDDARNQLLALAQPRLEHGGRGIRTLVESAVEIPLARWLFDHDLAKGSGLVLRAVHDRGPEAPYRYELDLEPGTAMPGADTPTVQRLEKRP